MYFLNSKNILLKNINNIVGILNLPTFGPQFLEEVKNVQRRSIFKSLFSDGLLAKEALRCGFMKYLESMQHSTNISNIMKRQII